MTSTYGIDFPFRDSQKGQFFRMTESPEKEVRANLIHLLLTKKGSRYYLPDFGTRIYEFIFEQNDPNTWTLIEDEIRQSVNKFIPNLDINSITVKSIEDEQDNRPYVVGENNDERLYRLASTEAKPYTARVTIDYTVNNGSFSSSDFIIINI